MRIKKKNHLGDYKVIQCQILQTNIKRTIWQTVRRITNEILGVKGLKWLTMIIQSASDGKKIIQRLQDALS